MSGRPRKGGADEPARSQEPKLGLLRILRDRGSGEPSTAGRRDAFRHTVTGIVLGAVGIGVVSGVIAALKPFVDPRGLSGLYVFAIFAVAMVTGFWVAGAAAIASYLTFDFFFAPPLHSFEIADGDVVATIAISLVTAFVVIALARRERARGREARLRAQEAEQAHSDVGRLADEQAALRRVATLVAHEASQPEVFAAIAEEIGRLLGTEEIRMLRYEDDRGVVVGSFGEHEEVFPIDSRVSLGGENVSSRVFRTGQPARIDDYSTATGEVAGPVRTMGIRSAVATPIRVEGGLWGAMVTGTVRDQPLPRDMESRLGQFTELMATAIANTESHAKAARLADERSALQRVATLVAEGVPPVEIFSAVSEEVGKLFGSDLAAVERFDPDGLANVVVGLATSVDVVVEGVTIGSRWELDDSMAAMQVYRSGRSARVDRVDWSEVRAPIAAPARQLGVVSAVSSPIIAEGLLWGTVSVMAKEPLPLHAEERLEKFTDLVATAIANAESREALRELADEQAALRRVATLVAEGGSPTAVFDAVAVEMKGLLEADRLNLCRYEPGGEITVLAHRGTDAWRLPPGSRISYDGESVTAIVQRTGRAARMETYEGASGPLAEVVRLMGTRSAIGAPVVVEGRVWGVMAASWNGEVSPPPETEERMAQFAALLDTAIANADSRDQLTASRARLLAAADEARRRVVRDLHDGAQQRLVSTIVTLQLAQQALQHSDEEADSLFAEALALAQQANAELRELARGILPTVLTRGGLRAGVDAVVTRLDLPVEVDIPSERFAPEIEASAYFIVAEALTNVVKHAHADRAEVRAFVEDGLLHLEVRDDGVGGADSGGHGLVGLEDRATALGGRLNIDSPAGGGTLVAAALPLSVAESVSGSSRFRAL
jgi:signal transduction histidine kinase